MLQLSLVEYPVADPFFFAVRSSFQDIKCLAGADIVGPLLTIAVHEPTREPGPATLLIARANALGIAWNPGSGMFTDGLGPFDLWKTSGAEVQMRLCWAWQQQVQENVPSPNICWIGPHGSCRD